MRTKAAIVFLMLCMFLLSSNGYSADEKFMEIVVVERDCLSNICAKYLDSPNKWPEIAKVNKLKNAHLILPGQKILIPIELAKGVPLDATVTFVKGDVQSRPKDAENWKTLNLGDKVSQGDSVKTGDAGTVELTFEDSTALLLRPNTLLEVKMSAQKGAVLAVRDFFLKVGRVISRVKSATGSESRYKITTPSAVAAARGTEFRVSVDEQVATRTEVLEGSVSVDAKAKGVIVDEGEGTLVKKNEAPGKPVKLLPPPSPVHIETLYRAMPVAIDFDKVPEATHYRVLIATDKDIKDVVADNVVESGRPAKVAGIEDGSYFMQTRSIDADGLEGLPSEPVAIKVRVNPLPPIIELPDDGAELRRNAGIAKWLKVGDAVGYHMQIAQDKGFQKIAEDSKTLKDTELAIPNLPFNAYYFRLSSIAADGYEGVWSDALSFTIIPPPPAPPVEKPEVMEKEIHLRWRNLGEGITYHFQMADDDGFKKLLVDRKVDKAETALEKPVEPGTYYVRTSGIDKTGYEGDFSPAQSFEIKKKTHYGLIGGAAGAVGVILLLILL